MGAKTRIQKKKKSIPLPFFLQRNSCTYGWERRKILRGRRGIRTDDFSSRSDTVDGTEIGIQWSDVEPSTGSGPTLNNPRYPTSDFIPCASTSYPRGGMCDPTPRSPSQPSLFAFSVHPTRPRFRRSVRWFHPPPSCCYFRCCAWEKEGRGRWSWFILVNRGEGGPFFYLGFDGKGGNDDDKEIGDFYEKGGWTIKFIDYLFSFVSYLKWIINGRDKWFDFCFFQDWWEREREKERGVLEN